MADARVASIDQTFILVGSMVASHGEVFPGSKFRCLLNYSEKIVTTRSSARGGLTGNVLLTWGLMVTTWWFKTRIAEHATPR